MYNQLISIGLVIHVNQAIKVSPSYDEGTWGNLIHNRMSVS